MKKLLSFLWQHIGEVCWALLLAFLFKPFVIAPLIKTDEIFNIQSTASISSLTIQSHLTFFGIWFICLVLCKSIVYFNTFREALSKNNALFASEERPISWQDLSEIPDLSGFFGSYLATFLPTLLIFGLLLGNYMLPELYTHDSMGEISELYPTSLRALIWLLIFFGTIVFWLSQYIEAKEKYWRDMILKEQSQCD